MTKFSQGEIVRKRSDRSIIGRIAQIVEGLILNQQFYVIDIGNRRIRVREDEIEATTATTDPREQFLNQGFGSPEQALLGLTFHRLNANLSNYIYSFNGSRTEFMPHQFKPLIKFLDSPSRRILIADEVGLGKTIEAGIILLELEARQELRGAMIVCPANLCDKWRMEMLERFEIEFEVMTGVDLAERLRSPDSAYRSLKIITSYESLRSEKSIEAIDSLENPFNIVIADEAHRVRNPYSQTNKAMQSLCGRTDALLLLTATPVNNRSEDLLSLLKLLDDSVFANDDLYNKQIALNGIILEVERRLRIEPIDYGAIGDLLDRFKNETGSFNAWQTDSSLDANPYFSRLREAVTLASISSLDDRVSAQRCAAKLNLLADYINRTRRAEVQEYKPVRDPNVFQVRFAQQEEDLYELVKTTAMRYFDQFRLPVMAFERMASSCLPAFIERFRGESAEIDEESSDDALGYDPVSSNNDDIDDDAASFQEVAAKLLSRYNPSDFERIDSKFATLERTLASIQKQEQQSKVIVFSFFRGTLRYLSRRLSAIGIPHVSIHGGVSNQDDGHGGSPRRRLYAQFRNDPSIRVMLSSEVGSEGLDFQFSNVVVNYDLPWNPMVIEQRIGRIDRIGQERDKLHIYAFVIQNTIDQLIHQHLLSKISVFKQCVGDLEAIVGSSLSELAEIAYRRELSETQRQEQMDQKASAILHRKQMMESLDEEASKSGSLHDYIRDELQRIRSGGRWLSANEMRDLVHRLLERNELELIIRDGPIDGVFTTRTTARAQGFFEAHAGTERSREFMRFQHDLRQDKLSWTFDQHIAFKQPTVHLFNARHPAIRILLRYFTQRHQEGAVFPCVGSFRFPRGDADIVPGRYLLGQYHANFEGPIRRREMLSVAIRVDPENPSFLRPQQAARILGRLTSKPPGLEEAPLPHLGSEYWGALIDQLSNLATEEIARRRGELEADQHEQRERRRMQIKAQREKDVRNAQVRIDGLLQQARISGKRKADGLIQYWSSQLERVNILYREQLARLEQPEQIHHEEENMFLAYCEVT